MDNFNLLAPMARELYFELKYLYFLLLPKSKGQEKMFSDVTKLIQEARRASVRSVNAIMTATYWEIGRRIVEGEQRGSKKAGYGEELIKNLSIHLATEHCGRGFSERNLRKYRQFYLTYATLQIRPTVSAKSHNQLKSLDFQGSLDSLSKHFPLPWSAYVQLLSVESEYARKFYEDEALRGGWSVRNIREKSSKK